jgi:hypothetical protein
MTASRLSTLSIESFEAGRIDAATFDHEAHLYLAWLYVRSYPLAEAIARFSAALRRLTAALGVAGKYHASITWFFLVLVNERRVARPETDWESFRADNRDLLDRDEDIVSRYYSARLLASQRAREIFVLPDRAGARQTAPG